MLNSCWWCFRDQRQRESRAALAFCVFVSAELDVHCNTCVDAEGAWGCGLNWSVVGMPGVYVKVSLFFALVYSKSCMCVCVCVPAVTCPGKSYIWTAEEYVGALDVLGGGWVTTKRWSTFFCRTGLEKRVVKRA